MNKENQLLEEIKDLIQKHGMEHFLSALISFLYSFGSKERYIRSLIMDINLALQRYKNRYED